MRKRGFTLIEVMAAVTILIIGLLSIVTLLIHGSKANTLITQRTIGFTLAEEVLETARNTVASDFIQGNNFELYDGSTPGLDCTEFGRCILGYNVDCINVTCDDFTNPVPSGCEAPLRPSIIEQTNWSIKVFYSDNIGYFQMTDSHSNCSEEKTPYARKVHIETHGIGTIEVCPKVFIDGTPNIAIGFCERYEDPRIGP